MAPIGLLCIVPSPAFKVHIRLLSIQLIKKGAAHFGILLLPAMYQAILNIFPITLCLLYSMDNGGILIKLGRASAIRVIFINRGNCLLCKKWWWTQIQH